jgi:PBSX family phage terminase large subunit
MDDIITYKILPKQMEFMKATEKEILMCGGMGSGKSLALCLKLIEQASIPGNICLLVRKHLTTLRKSTLRMLLEPEGTRMALLPLNSYEQNKVERTIQLNGGGTIIYTGCDDPLSIRSVNAGSVFVDEASELDEKEYLELLFRLRINVGDLSIHCATNPAHKMHFLYRRFEVEKHKNRRVIYSSSMDNQFLPQNNLDWLNQLTGDARSKYVDGQWADTEKLIYPEFSCTNNVKDIKYSFKRCIIGVDYGYANPTALVLCGVDDEDNMNIVEEWYKSKQLVGSIVTQIEIMMKNTGSDDIVIVIDPSAAGLIAECEAKGLPVQKANNDVTVGIDRVRDRINNKKLLVDSNCINIIREMTGYTYDDFGRPVKVEDHSLDAVRYISNYMADYNAKYRNEKVYIF